MHIKSAEFEPIYKDMLTQFPPEELKPYGRFCEILGENYKAYEFWEDEPVGYAIIFEDKNYEKEVTIKLDANKVKEEEE